MLQASIRGAHPRAFLESWLSASLAPMRVTRSGDAVRAQSLAEPGQLALPDQILDYTWGREHTIFDMRRGTVRHVAN